MLEGLNLRIKILYPHDVQHVDRARRDRGHVPRDALDAPRHEGALRGLKSKENLTSLPPYW